MGWMTQAVAIASAIVCAQSLSAKDNLDTGIVYGPKAAFSITAPDGWELSNTEGQSEGLACVLYPKGSSWVEAPYAMYAEIAGAKFTDSHAFATDAIDRGGKEREGFRWEQVSTGTTTAGHSFHVIEYRVSNPEQAERVAYVQLPGAVAYVVYAGRDEKSFVSNREALTTAVNTLKYRPEFIAFGSSKESN